VITIENKEIRGITLKHVIWVVAAIVSGVVFVMISYFGIMKGISKIDTVNDTVNEIRLQQKEDKRELKSEIDKQKGQITNLQWHDLRIDLILQDKGLMKLDNNDSIPKP